MLIQKRIMTQTSLIAYNKNPEVKQTMREKVYSLTPLVGSTTAWIIAKILRVHRNNVQPRLRELVLDRKVIECEPKHCPIADQIRKTYKRMI